MKSNIVIRNLTILLYFMTLIYKKWLDQKCIKYWVNLKLKQLIIKKSKSSSENVIEP